MLEFIIVIVCLFLNAFFAAFEMAFVTVSKEDFSSTDKKYASKISSILNLKKKPERILSVIQIGITLVGAVSAAVGGNGAIESFSPYLESQYGFSPTMSEAFSVAAVILPLTYFSVVFGELIPKTMAINNPRPVLMLGISVIIFLDKVLSPIISFLEISTSYFLKKLGADSQQQDEESKNVDINYLPMFHQKFVLNLIELHGKRAKDAMVSWDKVIKIDINDQDESVRDIINQSTHTRFPVYDGVVVRGVIHMKEFNQARWQDAIRPAQVFRPDEKLLNIFLKLQEKRQHLAVICDLDNKFLGIITLEDIIEEIVGEIQDEVQDSSTLKLLLSKNRRPLKSR